MLTAVNAYRAAAGVPPVAMDPSLSKGCREHAAYMVENRGKPQLYSINAHHQDPTLPGATPEGAACGRAADLYPNIDDPVHAVHGWMASVYHRRPIIAPNVQTVGIGYAPLPAGGRFAFALQFVWGSAPPSAFPVVYPANGQVDVPVDMVREEPNPIPPPVVFAGHPITLNFPAYEPLTGASATLVDGAGQPVPFFFSSPEQPASKYNDQPGIVALIPKEPLKTSTRYTAMITATWNGVLTTRMSTFTTMPRAIVDATDEAALIANVGKPVLLRGTIASASDMGFAYLTLEAPRGKTITTVVVEVLLGIVGGTSREKLYALRGRVIEAEGTPTLNYGSLHVAIQSPSGFRFVK